MRQNMDEQYFRILQKCYSYPEFSHAALSEGSIRHLVVEKVDESDINAVRNNITKTRAAVQQLKKYADSLRLQNELQPMYDYIEALEGALDKATESLTNVSFDTGVLSGLLGKKMSLPQITSAAIKLNTKAVDVGRGFSTAMKKIRGDLIPLLKDASKGDKLSDAIGTKQGLDLETIAKGVEDEMVDSLGGTLFKKVSGFFTKARLGKEADIMSTPGLDVDLKVLGKEIAGALMNATIANLLGQEPPAAPPESLVTDLADEMEDTAEQAEQSPEGEGEGAPGAEGEEGAKGEEGAEGAAEPGTEEEGPDSEPEGEGYALNRQDLKDLKGAMDKAKAQKKSQTKALGSSLNAILGKRVFAENKVYYYSQIIAESKRLGEPAYDRWQQLAGITDE